MPSFPGFNKLIDCQSSATWRWACPWAASEFSFVPSFPGFNKLIDCQSSATWRWACPWAASEFSFVPSFPGFNKLIDCQSSATWRWACPWAASVFKCRRLHVPNLGPALAMVRWRTCGLQQGCRDFWDAGVHSPSLFFCPVSMQVCRREQPGAAAGHALERAVAAAVRWVGAGRPAGVWLRDGQSGHTCLSLA